MKKESDSEGSFNEFDPNNAYMDLSYSKYQDKLISKIIDDPQIDKQQFVTKLISRVNSQDPELFMQDDNNTSQAYDFMTGMTDKEGLDGIKIIKGKDGKNLNS